MRTIFVKGKKYFLTLERRTILQSFLRSDRVHFFFFAPRSILILCLDNPASSQKQNTLWQKSYLDCVTNIRMYMIKYNQHMKTLY